MENFKTKYVTLQVRAEGSRLSELERAKPSRSTFISVKFAFNFLASCSELFNRYRS